jgi:hypothetical protein
MDGKDLFGAEVGILDDRQGESAYGIGSYRRDIDQCRHQKPACLYEHSSDQCLFDDGKRRSVLILFTRKKIFQYRVKHKESEPEVSEVFHHVPEFPERSIHIEKRSIHERIVQGPSCDDKQWPQKYINDFEDKIKNIYQAHLICSGGKCSSISLN